MFSYHSNKIVVSIFILGLVWLFKDKIFKVKKYLLASGLVAFFFVLLLLYSFSIGGSSRFETTSIFYENRGIIDLFKSFLSNYFAHFDFNFLFVKGDQLIRHHPSSMAQLYFWELPFVILGAFFLLKKKVKGRGLIFWWMLAAPIAAGLTTDVPNAVRSFLFLPTFQYFTAFGIVSIYRLFESKEVIKLFYGLVALLISGSLVYYLHMYFVHYPLESSVDWQYGYKEVVEYMNENGNNFEKIIVTNIYDQPYIYFLFFKEPLKVYVNDGEFYKGFNNLEFRAINWMEDERRDNVLLVGTEEEIPDSDKVVKEIKFLNGEIAFRVTAL